MANAFRGLVDVMKRFPFGVELETIGARREAIANAIVAVTGGTVAGESWSERWTVTMPDGRVWRVERDGSLSGHEFTGEIVTPKLRWEDTDILQNVVRAVRRAGAKVNATCGLHVHVGVTGAGTGDPDLDGAALARLAKLTFQQEALLFKALRVTPSRAHFCREASPEFIKQIVETRPQTREKLLAAWYGGTAEMIAARQLHRHQSRYRGLNLHAVAWHGTAEFRYFDGTLHAGQVKTYVQLALALVAKAYVGKHAIARKRAFNDASAKYDVRNFLLRLGMIGEEFATARYHLLDHLNGAANRQKPAPKKAKPAEPLIESEPAVASLARVCA